MKSTLKMILSLANGKSTTLSLASPRADLTEADVMDVLREIIAKKALIVGGSYVETVKRIYIQDVDDKALA